MTLPRISVVLPARNPHRGRLAEVLAGLQRQSLPRAEWDLTLVDNGSTPALVPDEFDPRCGVRIVPEARAGLLWARLRGLNETNGAYLVFIDDDTVPDVDFLAAAVAYLDAHPRVGTAGGKIIGRFEIPPPPWMENALWCLALRDSGDIPLEWSPGDGPFPEWTPIGAGLLVRRSALVPHYIAHVHAYSATIERNSWTGQGVGGVEDKDLVLHTLRAGWSTGYVPAMRLTHIIPANRLDRAYIERLIPGVERIWMRTLHAHEMDLFSPIHPATLLLRQVKAWWVMGAWRSPANRIHWLSSCGRLRGLADNYRTSFRYPAPAKVKRQGANP